ncbi:alpha-1,6-mannosyl-glycoprotein 2-beta-N-acetylglucosaminyltransferase [Patella vulgata]|uniref:alpha-1,6-mannosyl-glycoprotein 2-beta-N-acetylglucosaminyltransferase n=1 Tax=Patella vulgata TaxID=6465 RepID=UPI00217F99EE|nr:alpha-1,6-mannosyl-glycoprotein 2-beta-N-acetylglucosaminyltransferase [Patella vulgata]XP_050389936.1 alpha-1,6-mannosyl-glycoprotein 2-beta-N-acetylglucosaminyltransferase [Patella vulgata]
MVLVCGICWNHLPKMLRFSKRRFLMFVSAIGIMFTFRYFYNQFEVSVDNELTKRDTASSQHRSPERSSRKYDLNDTHDLQKLFDDFNKDQKIRNSNYNLDLSDSGIVILVQVHDREKELKMLVDSLKNVKDIEKCLVVFSHDLFLPKINNVIESIDFCSVMQIFFPYAEQIMKNKFPADSASDCPRDIGIEKAKKMGCTNADHPDQYGHYREAKFTQTKHHWVWKLNFVFNKIHRLKDFKGLVLRIEDDYYLGPDILAVIRMMNQHEKVSGGLNINKILIMGNYEDYNDNEYFRGGDRFTSDYWHTGIGRGMTFNKDLWQKISNCRKIFCTFDDYNWDWSLQKLIDTCLNGLFVLRPIGSRVFHVGKCNGFHRQNLCSSDDILSNITNYLKRHHLYMFPPKMIFINDNPFPRRMYHQVGNGGWADPRDHNLCLTLFNNS